jgi:hypothetical protein
MKRIELVTILLAAMSAGAVTSYRPDLAVQAGSVLPEAVHPRDGAALGFLEEGRITGLVGQGGDVAMALSAPHFSVLDEAQDLRLRDPIHPDSVRFSGRIHRLQLATGLALSQLGIHGGDWDLAMGVALVRQSVEAESGWEGKAPATLEDGVSVEPSLAWQQGDWTMGTALRTGQELALRIGRNLEPRAMEWGFEVGIPLRTGEEFKASAGVSKTFSQALSFEAQGSTSYRKAAGADGVSRLQRQSLGMQLGTSLRLRPWVSGRDPEWIANIIDPFQGTQLARWSYDWGIGVQADWDALAAQARGAVSLTRWF